jgi:hypothetical protein
MMTDELTDQEKYNLAMSLSGREKLEALRAFKLEQQKSILPSDSADTVPLEEGAP